MFRLPIRRPILGRTAVVDGILLAALALLSRLPFFFRTVIDWDESTHIVIGESLLRGHGLYGAYWVLKPPLLFVFHACVIAVLGLSVEAIRFAGALLVLAVGLCLRQVGSHLSGRFAGNLAAALFIVALTAIPGGQAVMSELVASAPLCIGFLLLSRSGDSKFRLLLAGVLFGVAAMVRQNLLLAVVGVVLWIVFPGGETRARKRLPHLALFLGGVLATLLLTALPFLLSGTLSRLETALWTAPLAYSTEQGGAWFAARRHLAALLGYLPGRSYSLSMLIASACVWIPGALGLLVTRPGGAGAADSTRRIHGLLLALALSVMASVTAGPGHAHYLIQLLPFFALSSALLVRRLQIGEKTRFATKATLFLAAGVCLWSVVTEYVELTARVAGDRPLRTGVEARLTEFLAARCESPCSVYLTDDLLVYGFLRSPPPIPLVTHASDIQKKFLVRAVSGPDATPKSEMIRLLRREPRFIVRTRRIWYFGGSGPRALLDEELRLHYRQIAKIEDRYVFERISESDSVKTPR